jgi:hypothetical protein
MGTFDLTLDHGTSSFTAGAAKFGADGLANGTYGTTPGAGLTALMASGNSQPINAFTWDIWFKVPVAASSGVFVFIGESGSANQGTGCWLGVDAGKAAASVGSVNAATVVSTTAINDNAEHLLSMEWTGGANGTLNLYLDGVKIGTQTGTGVTTGTTGFASSLFTVGGFGGQSSTGTFTPGPASISLDEASISSVAQYGGTNFTPPVAAYSATRTGQVALYHFDGDATDSNSASTTIAPNDANIIYSPFNWDVQAGRAKTINPGAYLRATIDGSPTLITATFDVASVTDLPTFAYRVNDGPLTQATVAATVPLTIPSDNAWASCAVEIVVTANDFNANRWTTDAAAVKFTGFTVHGATPATRAIQKRGLNLLFYGDSILEALYALKFTSSAGPPTDLSQADAMQGWGYVVGQVLGAEVGIVGFGGTGIAATFKDVPAIGTTYTAIFNTGTPVTRSFSTPAPDAIVINLGSNDSISTSAFQADYTAFLNQLLAATPATTVVVAMRPFSGSFAAQIAASVAACSDPTRAYYADTTGWHNTADGSAAGAQGLHPYGYDNVHNLGPRTAAAIRAAFAARGPMFVGLGGGAVKSLSPFRG